MFFLREFLKESKCLLIRVSHILILQILNSHFFFTFLFCSLLLLLLFVLSLRVTFEKLKLSIDFVLESPLLQVLNQLERTLLLLQVILDGGCFLGSEAERVGSEQFFRLLKLLERTLGSDREDIEVGKRLLPRECL